MTKRNTPDFRVDVKYKPR